MGRYNFNKKQCIKALKALGFYQNTIRKGPHDKYLPPDNIKLDIKPGQPPFIMITRGNKFHIQNAVIKELKNMGGDQLVEKFLQYL